MRRCNSCLHTEQAYNSCRNRHCPKCQGSVAAKWTEARSEELLPVEYFHTVFTLPKELRKVAYQNKRLIYGLFFEVVSETLQAVAKQKLGVRLAFYSILHTWNQQLEFHPHIHVVSPKGGLTLSGDSWKESPHKFFLPVRALSKVFRGKFIDALKKSHLELRFLGKCSELADKHKFRHFLATLKKSDWVVYSKKPFGSPTQVIKYLSSYVHRIAISNYRIKKLDNNLVTFSYRNSRKNNQKSLSTIPTKTFISRFLLHILPKNFTRVRHYGFLANNCKAKNLILLRKLLGEARHHIKPFSDPCSKCNIGTLETLPYFLHSTSLSANFKQKYHPPPNYPCKAAA